MKFVAEKTARTVAAMATIRIARGAAASLRPTQRKALAAKAARKSARDAADLRYRARALRGEVMGIVRPSWPCRSQCGELLRLEVLLIPSRQARRGGVAVTLV